MIKFIKKEYRSIADLFERDAHGIKTRCGILIYRVSHKLETSDIFICVKTYNRHTTSVYDYVNDMGLCISRLYYTNNHNFDLLYLFWTKKQLKEMDYWDNYWNDLYYCPYINYDPEFKEKSGFILAKQNWEEHIIPFSSNIGH